MLNNSSSIIVMHPTLIQIKRQQFINNLLAIREHIGSKIKICLPVKANAYGHGLLEISQIAAPYVDYLAVACLDEGLSLRQAQIEAPILVLGAIDDLQVPALVDNQLEFTVASIYKAHQVIKYCQIQNKRARIHLKIDTGMHRIGVRPATAINLIELALTTPQLDLIGIYSHFASSDELNNPNNQYQIEQFKQVVDYVKQRKPDIVCHLANSAAICTLPDSYFDMVRPGIMSYGYLPVTVVPDSILNKIKPCFKLISRVCYFKVVEANQGLSYNHRYITAQKTRVVTIPIGYGDGYRRGLSNLGQVIIRGHKYTISGTICMDMLVIDIGPNGEAYIGDEVVLIGEQGGQQIFIEELADHLNTIIYEILVGFNERIPRQII